VILGIDASNIRRGGGITHLAELLSAAQPTKHGFSRVIVWSGSKTLAQIEDRDWLLKVYDPLLDRSLPWRIFWQRVQLKKLAQSTGCNLLFVPGGSDASGFRPMVTMSQNLLPFEWREMLRYGVSLATIKLMLLRNIQPRTFRKADGVIFLTHYARETVMKVTGVLPGKTVVVPHGIDQRFYLRPRSQRPPNAYSKAKPFRLLYVSEVHPYKHQWYVAQAVSRLRREGISIELELVGLAYRPALKRLTNVVRRVDRNHDFIHYRGPIPYDDLPQHYHRADGFVFASSCENMPNILLEAMAAGLPIACSNREPMLEVLGDGGIYFNPESTEEIAQALKSLIADPALRERCAQSAYERAQQYSWRRCSKYTFDFLVQVANSG
jgi:glycosyltransferase involved in cell wall biosynthesis